ncbi:unnamed protein product [Nezara viridula]|nr:unnamed protein product [Nezara viridula]
MVMSGVV